MADEKHNNITHDYNLDELDGIPGEIPLERNIAWENLYLRLHKSNRIKKIQRYWMAAACILLALFFFGVSNLRKEKLSSVTHTKNKPAVAPPVLPQPLVKVYPPDKQTSVVIRPDQKKKENRHVSLQPAKIKIPDQPLDPVENTARNSLNNISPVHLPEIQLKPDAVLNTPAIANAKSNVLIRKLRVVHLNELDEPPASISSLAKNSGRPLFRLKWNEPLAATNNITENIYSTKGLVKIRLSSPN